MSAEIEQADEHQAVVAIASLGCAKNLVESEVLLADLAEAGCVVTGDYSEADIIVVNTCGFLKSAQNEAADTIDELVKLKVPEGQCQCLVVAGCWSQIAADEICQRWAEVDAVIGVNDRQRLVEVVEQALSGGGRTVAVSRRADTIRDESTRFRMTPEHWAYLRVSEGCSQRCTFCKIPQIRGGYRSKPLDAIVAEAEQLVASGVKELVLIGQETTGYGRDIGVKNGLATLLEKVNGVGELDWIRLMYTYPGNFDDSAISAIADLEKVVKYIDMPLQHINDRILEAMGRGTTRAVTEQLLTKLRDRVDDIALRTTMIVGFPTERDDEFNELLRFVRDFEFEALGAFAYSPEPGTIAESMEGQIDEQVKAERLDRLMRAQHAIAKRKVKAWLGKTFSVYVEGERFDRKYAIARHAQQAPEVDSATLISHADLKRVSAGSGTKLTVKCTRTLDYDLVARPATLVK